MKKENNYQPSLPLDDYHEEEGTLRPGAIRKKGSDNQLLIIALVLLAIIALMGIFDAHWGVMILTTLVEGILIYKLKNGNKNK